MIIGKFIKNVIVAQCSRTLAHNLSWRQSLISIQLRNQQDTRCFQPAQTHWMIQDQNQQLVFQHHLCLMFSNTPINFMIVICLRPRSYGMEPLVKVRQQFRPLILMTLILAIKRASKIPCVKISSCPLVKLSAYNMLLVVHKVQH